MRGFGGFFNRMFSTFSNADFAALMGVQFLVMAADGLVRGSIAKSIAFGGQEGFDITTVPSADYLLKVVLALYVPYTFLSPFIGVVIDRFERRRVLAVSSVITAAITAVLAVAIMIPLGDDTSEGKVAATAGLVLAMLVMQACVRIMLAVKSAALPGVLHGKDLMNGNGLSQAGGALFQVLGAGVAFGAGGALPSWTIVIAGGGALVVASFVAMRIQRMELTKHVTSFAQEAKRVIGDIVNGIREVAQRPAAALGLTAFQMLRYQFWGFALGVFALYARSLVESGDVDTIALGIVGGGGFVGGALGLVLAERWKDRVPPIRLLLGSMVLLGGSALVFGFWVSLAGFSLLLFCGFFSFFLGKISADTIMQQSMPDDFRGRAFALFDIAYNLGFIVPALILVLVWNDDRAGVLLIGSGVVFLALTALMARWARSIRDQLAPQDDLSESAPEVR
jgi:MFS family permease